MTAAAHPARLIVLRHAKAAWPDVPDEERPLAPRGRADAPAAGRWLRDCGRAPDLVICSPARRTRETWELAAAELGAEPEPEVVYDPRAYRAEAADLLDLLRKLPETRRTVLLVGHRPAVQDLVLLLAVERTDEPSVRVREKYPTAAAAVLALPGTWAGLGPGGALLTEFVVPRGERGAAG
ncbi:histidine phosphatase family protein [Kitasatospora sp. NPDC049258]|uniref:SixA phosphatase family protein n=1 Tax=Kitasatospora sp. NPDC049258 TaxID=3155394 RepID=UPI00343CC8CC